MYPEVIYFCYSNHSNSRIWFIIINNNNNLLDEICCFIDKSGSTCPFIYVQSKAPNTHIHIHTDINMRARTYTHIYISLPHSLIHIFFNWTLHWKRKSDWRTLLRRNCCDFCGFWFQNHMQQLIFVLGLHAELFVSAMESWVMVWGSQ